MLTSKYLRDNIEAIKESMAKRKSDYPVDEMLKLDEKLRKANMEVQQLRAERNKLSLEIADKKKKENVIDKDITAKVSEIKKRLDTLEKELPEDEKRLNTLLRICQTYLTRTFHMA